MGCVCAKLSVSVSATLHGVLFIHYTVRTGILHSYFDFSVPLFTGESVAEIGTSAEEASVLHADSAFKPTLPRCQLPARCLHAVRGTGGASWHSQMLGRHRFQVSLMYGCLAVRV